MQLRLGIRARATTDLDVVFAGRVEDWLARFDAVTMERSWNGFTIARKAPPVQIEVNTAGYRPWRVPLQLRYEGREFGSVSLEVAIDDAASGHQDLIEPDGIALAAFEIDPPRLVPCLDVPNQIAQKLHACTEPLPGGNDRVRDIVDIWLLLRRTHQRVPHRRLNHRPWPSSMQANPTSTRPSPRPNPRSQPDGEPKKLTDTFLTPTPIARQILDEYCALPDTLAGSTAELFDRFAAKGLEIVIDDNGVTRPATDADLGVRR